MENHIRDEEHIDKYFKKGDLHSSEQEDSNEVDESIEDEWVIGDKPPKDEVRVVFVRPKGTEKERRTRSS